MTCRKENPVKVARDIDRFAEFLFVAHDVSYVRVGQLLPRYPEGLNPRTKVKVIEVNKQYWHDSDVHGAKQYFHLET